MRTKLSFGRVLPLFIAACATSPDDVNDVEQDYSAAECSSAAVDKTLQVSGTLYDVTDNSPSTYGKATAVKSYIWEIVKTDFGAGTLDTGVFIAPSASGFPSSKYDTSAECTAINLKRRLYHRGQQIASSSVSGVWDADYGCQFPKIVGPYITNPPYDWFNNQSPVRVCASATDTNGDVVPLRLWARALRIPTFEAFTNPEVKVGGSWYRLRNDVFTTGAYCIRRGYNTFLSSSNGVCQLSWAFWNESFHTFMRRIPVVGDTCLNTIGTIVCDV